MARQLVRGVAVLAVLVTLWSVGGLAPSADAASPRCAIVHSAGVGGLDWTPLRAARVCSPTSEHGVSGVTYIAQNQIVVTYNEEMSSLRQVSKTTTHELTHLLEWRANPEQRREMYAFLHVATSGDYDAIPTAQGDDLARWKENPRERLAESMVSCQFGLNSFPGMALVPQSECEDFVALAEEILTGLDGQAT